MLVLQIHRPSRPSLAGAQVMQRKELDRLLAFD